MKLIDTIDFGDLKNEAERLVIDELESQLDKNNTYCKCNECILDMAAFALNNIKPYYRVSLLGKLYANTIEGTTYMNEVKQAVIKAIAKIGENPSHD